MVFCFALRMMFIVRIVRIMMCMSLPGFVESLFKKIDRGDRGDKGG
jgi:hypothetical protein